MTRIRLHIRYQGTNYSGWQKQSGRDDITIQGTLEKALTKLTGFAISTVGSGRTDAGVHARHQVVHFEFEGPADRYPWIKALNSHLPEDIQVFEALEAPNEFHALHSAKLKHYIYYIQNSQLPPVFRRQFCWWQPRKLDLNWLNEASQYLVGTHDFKSFQNVGTPLPDTIRTISRAEWEPQGTEFFEFHVEGNGFLKQMVRNLVGTLVDLNLKGEQPSEIMKVLQSKDRSKAGKTAPAQGLILNAVSYPATLDNQCRKP